MCCCKRCPRQSGCSTISMPSARARRKPSRNSAEQRCSTCHEGELLPLANNPFTLFNADTAAASRRPTLSAFFHGSHAAFRLRANAEAYGTDLHTDTGRRPLLNDPASLRGRVLNDVVVRKARRSHESCQGSSGEQCAHGSLLTARSSPLNLRGVSSVPSTAERSSCQRAADSLRTLPTCAASLPHPPGDP